MGYVKFFRAFVHKHKLLLLFAKVLLHLKRNGIKTTIKKIIWYNNKYFLWIKQNEPSIADLKLQRKLSFSYRPKISIVIQLYNTSLYLFRELLASVQAQTYDNWELCLADGSLKKNKKIEGLCAKDERIHYRFLGENKGISENTNEAIKFATGDYIAFMDHDDTLAPFALYENVKCINEQPDIEFIYSDEDRLINNKRCNPYLKPDFAPDTLRSCNCIMHFVVMKQSLTERIGTLNSDYDKAQDYDYVLRASEATTKIYHIRKILYHWRCPKTSPKHSSDSTLKIGAKALEAHMTRIGFRGTVKLENAIYYSIYDVIGNPSVSIIIPNKDYMSTLKICVDSILERSTYNNYEIVIIENNSEKEETFEYYRELEKHPKIRVLYYPEKGFNYSKLINLGVKNSSSDYIVQLNNDTEVITPNWLELMLGIAQRPDVGAVGAKLLYPDGSIQHAGLYMYYTDKQFQIRHIFHSNSIKNYIAVTGACIMSRKNLYEQINYMDESFPVSFGDINFCFVLRDKGFFIVYNPHVELYHYESKTRGQNNTPEKIAFANHEREYFFNKWAEKISTWDPYVRIEYLDFK